MLRLAAIAAIVLAQDKQEPPPHELHIRAFKAIWKEIEPKQAGLKSWKAEIAVQESSGDEDATRHFRGEVFVKREEKQQALLAWRIGTREGTTQRTLHDGSMVIITDERDAADLRYWKREPADWPRALAQEILLTGGRDLEKSFDVTTIQDPKIAKKARTSNTRIDESLNRKDGEEKAPDENRVETYTFRLKPLGGDLAKEIDVVQLKLDPQTFRPVSIFISCRGNRTVAVAIHNPTKLDVKEIEEKKPFELTLPDTFKRGEE